MQAKLPADAGIQDTMEYYRYIFGDKARDLKHLVDKSSRLEKLVKEIGSKWIDTVLSSAGVYGAVWWFINRELSSFGNYRNTKEGKAPFEMLKLKGVLYLWKELRDGEGAFGEVKI